jgi:hypothetical protein
VRVDEVAVVEQELEADIEKVNGVHDLYFVFKNDNAKNTDVLLSVADIKFNEKQ